jgi:UDP-N-acetyl-D-glucosamine dehydrogenase
LKNIKQKLEDKTATIGIIGMGYVGLPLAVSYANKGFKTIGFDVQQKRVDLINQGSSFISDIKDEQLKTLLKKQLLEATTDQSRLKEVNAICICVPTPLTKTKDPDLSYITHEANILAKYIQKDQLIVLESTTYPGTTREVVLPILETSGFKCGTDFYLAFSPERIDPGNKNNSVNNTPKVVGGINPDSTELAKLLYSQVAASVFPVSCAEVAEMTKVFENVFRSVNIALVNELAQLCEVMKFSVWEVIAAASTKPFGYMPFYPGPGIGGHCIPLDPYYLATKAREYDFHTRFIELAAEINERMPYYVVQQVMKALNNKGKSIKDATILILGVAYKKDIEDMRESPSLKLIELFNERKANIIYNDPHIEKINVLNKDYYSTKLTPENLSSADCTVIATDHSAYNLEEIVKYSNLIFDTRGVTRKFDRDNIIRLGE